MATEVITQDSFPGEYSRPPVFARPPLASMPKAVERVLAGETHLKAFTPRDGSRTNGG
jgi:hypothetical protein